MAEIIEAANSLTWPGAVAVVGVCAMIVGVAFAWASAMNGK